MSVIALHRSAGVWSLQFQVLVGLHRTRTTSVSLDQRTYVSWTTDGNSKVCFPCRFFLAAIFFRAWCASIAWLPFIRKNCHLAR